MSYGLAREKTPHKIAACKTYFSPPPSVAQRPIRMQSLTAETSCLALQSESGYVITVDARVDCVSDSMYCPVWPRFSTTTHPVLIDFVSKHLRFLSLCANLTSASRPYSDIASSFEQNLISNSLSERTVYAHRGQTVLVLCALLLVQRTLDLSYNLCATTHTTINILALLCWFHIQLMKKVLLRNPGRMPFIHTRSDITDISTNILSQLPL